MIEKKPNIFPAQDISRKDPHNPRRLLWVYDLGRIAYSHAWLMQKKLVEKRAKDIVPDIMLIAEHNDVLTCGKALFSPGTSMKKISNIPFHMIERGGSETYHGPGQIMGYPIIKLLGEERDIHKYLRNLEKVLIKTSITIGLRAKRIQGYTGVWVDDKKIASIGIAVRKWVTFHGFALNHCPDLSKFHLINPCGLNPECISSINQLLGYEIHREKIVELCLKYFGEVFSRYIVVDDSPINFP